MTERIWLGIVALVVLILLAALVRNPKLLEKLKGDKKGFSDPKILILVGVIIFDLISWLMIPWFWSVLYYRWYTLLIFNVGFWVASYLKTIKIKDKDGKETNDNDPTAARWANIIILMLAVGMFTLADDQFRKWWGGKSAENGGISQTATNLSHGAPLEIARMAICECESGGKQFEPDGITPLKNKGVPSEGIPPSSAFGKYQFLESHRQPALALGFDLNTEEGQDRYFEYRYNLNGTKDWEADPRSVACWEPKLKGFTWAGGEAIAYVVDAPTNTWGRVVPIPYAPKKWELNGFGRKYKALWNGTIEEDLPRPPGAVSKQPSMVYTFRLKSEEPELAKITYKVY